MIKKKVKKKQKRKNPNLEFFADKILSELNTDKFEFIGEGNFGEIYLFEINQNKFFENTILKPNRYILKVFRRTLTSIEEINRLKILSKYGLIPKIYIITSDFIIMRYIKGITLLKFEKYNQDNPKLIHSILIKINNLIKKWHSLKLYHGDLGDDNILITEDNKVYFIDPYFNNHRNYNNDLIYQNFLKQYL